MPGCPASELGPGVRRPGRARDATREGPPGRRRRARVSTRTAARVDSCRESAKAGEQPRPQRAVHDSHSGQVNRVPYSAGKNSRHRRCSTAQLCNATTMSSLAVDVGRRPKAPRIERSSVDLNLRTTSRTPCLWTPTRGYVGTTTAIRSPSDDHQGSGSNSSTPAKTRTPQITKNAATTRVIALL